MSRITHVGGSKLKRILLIVSSAILFVILAVVLSSNYTEKRLKEYLMYIPSSIESFTKLEVENFKLDRLIKKSPKELIILVKWDNNSAFISIKDWLLPRTHDEIEIRVFSDKYQYKIYE
jgi:hypothetical protein